MANIENVLTLIAATGKTRAGRPGLKDSVISDVRQALGRIGGETAPPEWLSDGEAADIAFADIAPNVADAAARQAVGARRIDVVAQAAGQRKKKLLIADMDSTIITGETLDELATLAGLRDKIAALTRRAMAGEIGFADALKKRVSMLAGMDEGTLEKTWKRIKLSPGAATLVTTMRANGAYAVLVSGGFSFFTERVRQQVGFDAEVGNRLVITDGRLSGEVVEPIVNKDTKLEVLTRTAAQQGLGLGQVLAIGDGANDVPMLGAAGLSIAYRPHAVAAAAATAAFFHADLSGALFAQGYRRDQFVA